MNGPYWNNGKTGVTGEPTAPEPAFRTREPDYLTVDGKTYVGEAAEQMRRELALA